MFFNAITMSIYQHYLEKANSLIASYKSDLPFHLYLKQHFSNHRKYGSRDRKTIASLCYNYFRIGFALDHLPMAEKIIYGTFLVNTQPSKCLLDLQPELDEKVGLSLSEKLRAIGGDIEITAIFPFQHLMSGGILANGYCKSMLDQPDVFLRARPAGKFLIENKLKLLEWDYKKESDTCYRINNGLQIEAQFAVNRELVIQDYNSQKVGTVISNILSANSFQPRQLWDCCAASGGKSIMLKDIYTNLELTVSDVRPSILKNLETRFREAGIKPKHQFVADLVVENTKLPVKEMDLILADVPCSGSGTWARTPEQLFCFKEAIIDDYAQKQKAILKNVIRYLKQGGFLVYVTCSVFKKENEDIVDFILNEKLKMLHMAMLDGTSQKADSMFIAIFQR